MSFAKEIKDFLGAYTTVSKNMSDAAYKRSSQKYNETLAAKMQQDMDDPLNDEVKKANIAAAKARANASNSAAARNNAAAKLYSQPALPPEDPTEGYAPARATQPAAAVGAVPMPAVGAAPTPDTGYYAEGGLVPDEDDDPTDEDDVMPPAVGGSTDVSAQSRRSSPQISQTAAHDAVAAGLKYGVSQLGAIPGPARQRALQGYVRGAGAATPVDMEAIYKKIDPDNQMGESERAMNAMSALYQFKMRKGDARGAQAAAFGMLQHYRLASQRYAAISAAAANSGNPDGAAKAAMKAYANIPDGKDLKITKSPDGKLSYTYTGEDGKVISQGLADPQQLAAAAMKVATNGFDSFLLSAAGERAATKGATGSGEKSGRAPTARDLQTIRADIGSAVENFAEKAKITDEGQINAFKNSAYHIAQQNPGLAPNEAFDAAHTFIASPEPKKGEKGAFEIQRDENTGKNRITFGDTGRTIILSDDELQPLRVLRGKALKAGAPKEEKGGKSYSDYAADAGNAVVGMAGDAVDYVRKDLDKAAAAYPETAARIKSAVGAGKRAIGDAVDYVKKEAEKPNIWKSIANGPGDGRI